MFKKQQRYSFKGKLPSRYLNTQFFNLRYEENKDEGFHCAVVVGKKIAQKASVRNTLKRRFVHALKEVLAGNIVSYNLVFFLKRGLQELDFQAIKEQIRVALKTANIFEKDNK